jgi:hypothetical protein
MSKLISCMAAGILLLAAGMEYSASAAPLSRGGAPASAAGAFRGGGASSVFHGNATVGSGSPVFRGNPGVVTAPGGGSPVYRGPNTFASQGRDWDGDRGRFRHRRFFGPGVFAYGAYSDYSDFDDGSAYIGSAYIDDSGECGYVWVRRYGVLHRVYTCQ